MNSPTKQTTAEKFRFEALDTLLLGKFYPLLDELGIKFHNSYGTRISFACPVHGSRKTTSCSINTPNHDSFPGRWCCWSNGGECETTFRSTLLGLIRGVLSHEKYGWSAGGDKTISLNNAISWGCDFVGVRWNDIQYDARKADQDSFIKEFSCMDNRPDHKSLITRDKVRATLEIPPQFYLEKGYSREILDEYDIGVCKNPDKEMYNRVVAPVYKDGYLVGCTGRSLFPKCPDCSLYHQGDCPQSPRELGQSSKWKNSKGFDKSKHLFGYDQNLGLIRKARSCIITESVGNALRLQDAGIKTVVATFGAALSPEQQSLLDRASVMTLLVCYDNDDAGRKGAEAIRRNYGKYYNLKVPDLCGDANDIGEFSPDYVKQELKPRIMKLIGDQP